MNTTEQTPEDHDKNAAQVDAKKKRNDVTGQTDTTVKEMKARLKEVPHTSAGSDHDKDQYDKKHRNSQSKKGSNK